MPELYRYNKNSHFLPSVHGWPFKNLGNYGKCGGMCFAAMDAYYTGLLIPRDLPEPERGDDLWEEISERQLDSSPSRIRHKLRDWMRKYSYNERTTKSWETASGFLHASYPHVLVVVQDIGLLGATWRSHQIIVHHAEIVSDDKICLWIYDPNADDTEEFDWSGDQIDWTQITVHKNGIAGTQKVAVYNWKNAKPIYGIFENPFDKGPFKERPYDIVVSCKRHSVERIDHNGIERLCETLEVTIKWDCKFIPFFGMRIDGDIVGYNPNPSNENCFDMRDWPRNGLMAADCTQLPAISGEKTLYLKRIVYRGDRTRDLEVKFLQKVFNFPIEPICTSIIISASASSDENRSRDIDASSNEIQNVVPEDVVPVSVVHADDTEDMNGDQIVFIDGNMPSEWVGHIDPALEESYLGFGVLLGYVKTKIHGYLTKKDFFVDTYDSVNVSLVVPRDHSDSILESGYQEFSNISGFCINDIFPTGDISRPSKGLGVHEFGFGHLVDNIFTSRGRPQIKNGFTEQDYQENARILIKVISRGAGSFEAQDTIIIYAKNHLIYSGTPHSEDDELVVPGIIDFGDSSTGDGELICPGYNSTDMPSVALKMLVKKGKIQPTDGIDEIRKEIKKIVTQAIARFNSDDKTRRFLNRELEMTRKAFKRKMLKELHLQSSMNVEKIVAEVRNQCYRQYIDDLFILIAEKCDE